MELSSSIILCALFALVQANTVDLSFKYDSKWLSWKQEHDKAYESDIHELEKYVTWVSNNAMIEAHNKLESDFGYTLGMNQFGDMVSHMQFNVDHIYITFSVIFGILLSNSMSLSICLWF